MASNLQKLLKAFSVSIETNFSHSLEFEPVLCGSVNNGTKVLNCDEFDMHCVFSVDIQTVKDDENALYCSVRTKEKGLRKVCDYAGYIDATKFTANFGQILDTVVRKGSNPVTEEAISCHEKCCHYARTVGRFLKSILIWCDPFEPYGVKNLKLEKSE